MDSVGYCGDRSLSPLSLFLRTRLGPGAAVGMGRETRLGDWLLPLAGWGFIVLLGWLGRYLPRIIGAAGVNSGANLPIQTGKAPPAKSPWPILLPMLYIGLGFALSWLAVIFWGKAGRLFPPLLLIVVIRGCQLFPWRGRLGVAFVALSSFVAQQYLTLLRLLPLIGPRRGGDGFGPPGFGHRERQLPEELLRSIKLDALINASLLFGLVLGFVLLLVGALLQEQRSRQQLAEANQQLRHYSLRIEDQATLQERSRIAREIHDSVGHCLTAQSIQLENVALRLGPAGPAPGPDPDRELAQQHLEAARRLGREALQSVRQAVSRLRIHPLQGRSLDSAIARLVEDFQAHSGIALGVQLDVPQNLSQDVAIVLYRIAQEGLTNLTKHSQASGAQLVLQATPRAAPRTIQLRITDNGVGFEPSQNTTGFGLQSMAERAAAVGGQFRLTSAPGQGCTLELTVPL
ncbi:MAG: sensor histidine kinase [Synechococcales cyanobacterium RM1_1_8]|nr:sensor histidine kinase [Synechococcales cyanobacterium RM1_1_8]